MRMKRSDMKDIEVIVSQNQRIKNKAIFKGPKQLENERYLPTF